MTFTVRVRGIEIVCESLEDVDAIIDRYGSAEGADVRPIIGSSNGSATRGNRGGGDMALLRQFIEAGSTGVTSTVIGQMLGTAGKGVPPALQRWGIRIGLAENQASLPLEQARPKGARGWRLNEGGMITAREIVK